MGNGAIIIPNQDIEHPSRWYFRVEDVEVRNFEVDTYGITKIQNSKKAKQQLSSFNVQRRLSRVKRTG
jgi:hypothetical protein